MIVLASAKSNGFSTSLAFEYNSIKAELRSFSLSSYKKLPI
jgi:hypothetical protein